MISTNEAKAHDPSPDVDISFTSSWACPMATSNGGFRGFLFDSVTPLVSRTDTHRSQSNRSMDLPKMAELREAHTDSRWEGWSCQPTGLAQGFE